MPRLPSIFNRYSVLKQIPLFNRLHWYQLQTVAAKSKINEYKKGEIIISQGTPPDGFYCLISGRIQCFSEDEQGRKYDVDFIRRGTPFGVTALLTSEKHAHSFVALNDSMVLKIDRDDFQEILKSFSYIGIELSQNLSQKIRQRAHREKTVFESTIIGIYCPVKGTGTSTYAVNLALSLQRETFKKVILVNLSSAQAGEQSHADAIQAAPQWKTPGIRLQDIIDGYEKTMAHVAHGELSIDYLYANFDPKDKILVEQISHFVTAFVNEYHYVVLDLPNEMDEVVLKTLSQCDLIQLYSLDRKEDLEGTRRVINELEEELKEYFHPEKINVIIRQGHPESGLPLEEVNRELDYEIYRKLPVIQGSDITGDTEASSLSVVNLSPLSPYAQTVRCIARQISNVLVGLVLGGGAAMGLAHIGVLRVIEEEQIPIDVIAGSSMGALIGGLWAVGKSSADIEKIAREFETRQGLLKLYDPVVPVSGFIGGQAIRRWLRKHLGNMVFFNTRVPLYVVAYDLVKRQELVINSGSLVDAIVRSVAIPGIMNPVMDKEKMIIDGGILNPLPTNVLKNMGIRKIIAVNVLQSPEDVIRGYQSEQERLQKEEKIPFTKSPGVFIWHRISKKLNRFTNKFISNIIVSSLQASEYLISEQSSKLADVAIHPDLAGMNWYELFKIDEFIRRGEQAARSELAAIKQLIQTH